MTNIHKTSKVIVLIAISYFLFLLFVFNFRVITIEALFSINNFFWYMFLISLISATFFTNSLIYFAEDSEKYAWFSLFLASICTLTGSFFLLQELDKSIILSIIICLAFIPSVLIPINNRKNYININSFTTFSRIQRYIALFLALSFAFSFYFYENLDTNNPRLATFMNSFIDQTTANALKTVGINPKVIEPAPVENSKSDFIKQKLSQEIANLKGPDLEMYNNNKGFIDSVFNTFINTEKQKEQAKESPFTKSIKDTINNFINTYKQLILVGGSILVYFFISSVFYFSGIVTIPLFTLIYNILIKMGVFEKVKKKVEVERLEL